MALKKKITEEVELYLRIRTMMPDKDNAITTVHCFLCERNIETGNITPWIMFSEQVDGLHMTVDSLSGEGSNPWKSAYEFFKKNHSIFKHFEDC